MSETVLGKGVYAVGEVARLTGINRRRIRRWLGFGGPGVVEASIPRESKALELTFHAMLELRVINELRRKGIAWPVIKRAHRNAQTMFDEPHPFASQRLQTDGHAVFADQPELIDLAENQFAFRRLMRPFLVDLDFIESLASRWWPMGVRRKGVVIDPSRSFGQPILTTEGIPTRALELAFKAEGDIGAVARWFDISERSVRIAVDFEKSLESKVHA